MSGSPTKKLECLDSLATSSAGMNVTGDNQLGQVGSVQPLRTIIPAEKDTEDIADSRADSDLLDVQFSMPKRPPPKLSSARGKSRLQPNTKKAEDAVGSDIVSSDRTFGLTDENLHSSVSMPRRLPPKLSSGPQRKARPQIASIKPPEAVGDSSGNPGQTSDPQTINQDKNSIVYSKSPDDALRNEILQVTTLKKAKAIEDSREGLEQTFDMQTSLPSKNSSVKIVEPTPPSEALDNVMAKQNGRPLKLSSSSPPQQTLPSNERGKDSPSNHNHVDDDSAHGTVAGISKSAQDATKQSDDHEDNKVPSSPSKEKQKLGVTFRAPVENVMIIDGDVPVQALGDRGATVAAKMSEYINREPARSGGDNSTDDFMAEDLFILDNAAPDVDILATPGSELDTDFEQLVKAASITSHVSRGRSNKRADYLKEEDFAPVSISSVDGSAIYKNICFMRPHGFTENALKIAILKEDPIVVDMLLTELGSYGPSEILLRDGLGRNCIHIAVIGQSAASEIILLKLLNCFTMHSCILLKRDISLLEKQYENSVNNLSDGGAKAETSRGMDSAAIKTLSKYPLDSARAILDDWFVKEERRIKRRTEFAIEMWWLKAVTARDVDGRTPLHYAAMINNSTKATYLMSSQCRGRFSVAELQSISKSLGFSNMTDRFGDHPSKQDAKNRSCNENKAKKHNFLKGYYSRLHRLEASTTTKQKPVTSNLTPPELYDLLKPNCYYNTLSGDEVAEAIYEKDTRRGPSSISQETNSLHITRSSVKDGAITKTNKIKLSKSPTKKTSRADVAAIQNQLSASLHMREQIESTQAFVDYEVVVPWVLRNMLRRATDLSLNFAGKRFVGDKNQHYYGDNEKVGAEEFSLTEDRASAIRLLKELFEDCKEAEAKSVYLAEDRSDPLYVSQGGLSVVLNRLGVRVTEDVIHEVALRYQYFGKVENAISEFDFDDYVDEYDEVCQELLQEENPPSVAEKKNTALELTFNLSTKKNHDEFTCQFDRSSLSRRLQLTPKTSKARNSLSKTDARPVYSHRKDFNIRRHVPSATAENKLNKTWHHPSEDQPASKAGYADDYEDEKGAYSDDSGPEYDENFDYNRDLRRDIERSRRIRLGRKLKELARTVYLNVDLLLDDIQTGSGLQSINLFSGSHGMDLGVRGMTCLQSERRKNLVRAVFHSSNVVAGDSQGVLSVDTSEGYKYLYGDCGEYELDDSELKLSDYAIKQIENEINHDSQPVMRPVISANGVISCRRRAVNAKDRFGCTPLHLAAACGLRDIATMLIQEGADVTASFLVSYANLPDITTQDSKPTRNEDDEATLCDSGDAAVNDKLLKPTTITPLSIAKSPGVRSVLITALANRLGRKKPWRSQMLAQNVQSRHSVHVNVESTDTAVKLQEAEASAREFEFLSNLGQLHGHKFNLSRPALSWAVSVMALDTVKQLLSSLHANPNAKDAVGRTALHECCALACAAGDSKSVFLKLSKGTGPAFTWGELRAIADLLLEAGANPSTTSVAGRAPMHELFCRLTNDAPGSFRPSTLSNRLGQATSDLAKKARRAVLRSLLHWGADALQPDRNQGLTPMHYCAREDAVDCMMELLSYLSVHSPRHEGKTSAIDSSAKESETDREKCGPYFRCRNGRTCLHVACVSSAFHVVDMLTRWDADNAIIGSTRMCLQLSRASKSFSSHADEPQYDEYSLATLRDCNGKTPSQLIGQRRRDDIIITFWERCYTGDIKRVEDIIQSMHGALHKVSMKPQWEGVNESDTLFMTNNVTATQKKRTNLGDACRDDKDEGKRSDEPFQRDMVSPTLDAALMAHSDLWSIVGIDSKTRLQRWTPLHCCILGWSCAAALGSSSAGSNLCTKRALGNLSVNEAAVLSKKLYKRTLLNEGSEGSKGFALRSTNSGGFAGMSHTKETKKYKNRDASRRDDTLVRNNILCSTLLAGKHQTVAMTLLRNKAFVDSLDCKARTPLMFAAACNLLDAIILLLDSDADMNLKDNISGNTALHYAYATGSMAAASLLEERGADMSVKNCDGKIPIDVTGIMNSIGGGLLNSF